MKGDIPRGWSARHCHCIGRCHSFHTEQQLSAWAGSSPKDLPSLQHQQGWLGALASSAALDSLLLLWAVLSPARFLFWTLGYPYWADVLYVPCLRRLTSLPEADVYALHAQSININSISMQSLMQSVIPDELRLRLPSNLAIIETKKEIFF